MSNYYSYTEKYETVKLTGYKAVPCLGCGKMMKRQRTFSQTLNPWNKSKVNQGHLKRRDEIIDELKVKIEEWKKTPAMHEACAEKA